MRRTLKTKPEFELNVSEQQLRAIGHVTLQWAYLESDIVRHLKWLYSRSEHKKKKKIRARAYFSQKATRWAALAHRTYKKHPDLIRSVDRIKGRAIKIKAERDALAHGTMSSDGPFLRYSDGVLVEILDTIATPEYLEDLACRISEINADLLRHEIELDKRFRTTP